MAFYRALSAKGPETDDGIVDALEHWRNKIERLRLVWSSDS